MIVEISDLNKKLSPHQIEIDRLQKKSTLSQFSRVSGDGTVNFDRKTRKQAKRKKRERELPYWPEFPDTPMQKYFHLWWIDEHGIWTMKIE